MCQKIVGLSQSLPIGLSFLGRVDYGLFAGWALVVLFLFLFKTKPKSYLRNVAIASLVPGLLFLLYPQPCRAKQ